MVGSLEVIIHGGHLSTELAEVLFGGNAFQGIKQTDVSVGVGICGVGGLRGCRLEGR